MGVAKVEALRKALRRHWRAQREGATVWVLTAAVLRPDGTGEIEVMRLRKGQEKHPRATAKPGYDPVHPVRYRFDLDGVPLRKSTSKRVVRFILDMWEDK